MSNHNLSDNDTITFYNTEGEMESFKKEWLITIINKNTFQLNNFDISEFTFINASFIEFVFIVSYHWCYYDLESVIAFLD